MNEDTRNDNYVIQSNPLDALAINNKKKISEELFIKLRDAILSGELPEGYVFPSESVLCKQLDVGRSTLREAFAALETHNLITRNKTGTHVNRESDIRNAMSFDMIMRHANPEHVMQFRAILEIGSAGSAANRTTPNDIKILEATLACMEQNPGDHKLLTICDYDFHSHIVKMTGNELLYTTFNAARSYYEEYVLKAFQKDIFKISIADHKKIIAALKAQDAAKARAAMHDHLRSIEPFIEVDSEKSKAISTIDLDTD